MTEQELSKIEAVANNHHNPAMRRTLLRMVAECRRLRVLLAETLKQLDGREAQVKDIQARHIALERDIAVERDSWSKQALENQRLKYEMAELNMQRTADQETIRALRSHNELLSKRIAELEHGKKKKKKKKAVKNAPWISPMVFPPLNTITTTTMDNVSGVVKCSGAESGQLKPQAVLVCGYFS